MQRKVFSKVSEVAVQRLERLVGSSNVIRDEASTERYNIDWMQAWKGASTCIVRPSTTEEVAAVLRLCNEENIPVVPQGGNTGLVGGSIPFQSELVLSLERMRKIRELDEHSGCVTAEAGCVLDTVDQALGEKGWMMPLDLGAKGSCQIGGNLSTNAGGLRYLRYGSLHGSTLGLEAVLADGTVLNSLSPLRKDNVGYDLKQLFIGSEGTLGVITAAAIQGVPRPKAVNLALLALNSFEDCVRCVSLARQSLSEVLSACEFMDRHSLSVSRQVLGPMDAAAEAFLFTQESRAELAAIEAKAAAAARALSSSTANSMAASSPGPQHLHKGIQHASLKQSCPSPVFFPSTHYPFYMLLETSGSNSKHDEEKLESFLEEACGPAGLAADAIMSGGGGRQRQLWKIREQVPVAMSKRGHVFKYDLSFRLPHMYSLVEEMRERLQRWEGSHGVRTVGYGHLGDANVHLNVSTPVRRAGLEVGGGLAGTGTGTAGEAAGSNPSGSAWLEELQAEIEPFVYERTLQMGGSISAEHGVGRCKAEWLSRARPAPAVSLMQGLKQLLDPKGILNPGKVLPMQFEMR